MKLSKFIFFILIISGNLNSTYGQSNDTTNHIIIGASCMPYSTLKQFVIYGRYERNELINFEVDLHSYYEINNGKDKNHYFFGGIAGLNYRFWPLYKEKRRINFYPSTKILYQYGIRNYNEFTYQLLSGKIITQHIGLLIGMGHELKFSKKFSIRIGIQAGPAYEFQKQPPCEGYVEPFEECSNETIKRVMLFEFFDIGLFYRIR